MFKKQARRVVRVLTCRRGNSTVEYALMLALVAMVGSVAATTLGASIRTMFTSMAGSV